MRCASRIGLVGRLLMAAGILGLLAGCTQSATSPARQVTERAGQSAQPAANEDAAAAPRDDQAASNEVVATGEEPAEKSNQLPVAAAARTSDSSPAVDGPRETRVVAKPIVSEYSAKVPPVLLSAGHSKLCKVNVGDVIPAIELPKLGGASATLESLGGQKATVVLFWSSDPWMSATALGDLARLRGREGVSVVGIGVGVKADAAAQIIATAKAQFPHLLDEQGTALAQVGVDSLPRIYVLDGQRRIAWFDIEYSEATRRELQQTLAALTGGAQ